MKDLMFTEIEDEEFFADYSADCSGGRSDCCTRVCTRNDKVASEQEWGNFLQIEGGIIQY